MANLETQHLGSDINSVRLTVRRSARMQQTRLMLVAAGLCAFGMVAVAATLLAQVI